MKLKRLHSLLGLLLFTFPAFGQGPSDPNFIGPTAYKFEALQDSNGAWWNSFRLDMFPGVGYKIQRSYNLVDWEDISSFYGMDSEMVCPLFPGMEPVSPNPDTIPVPTSPGGSVSHASLMLEKTTTGAALISWNSLDDGTPKRMILSGVTLDPIWDNYESTYLNPHGDYIFVISPNVGNEVTFSDPAPTLGTKDSALVAALIAALPDITDNVTNNVNHAANYNPLTETTEDRAFFRIVADWGLDSDGDSRKDWQELVFDGNNPFAADTDGDGQPDQAAAAAPAGFPVPGAVAAVQPRISYEWQNVVAELSRYSDEENAYVATTVGGPLDGNYEAGAQPQSNPLAGAASFSSFASQINSISYPEGKLWAANLHTLEGEHFVTGEEDTYSYFHHQRQRIRISLNAAAPEGGYSTELKFVAVYQQWESQTFNWNPVATPSGLPTEITLNLTVQEGQTKGEPVEIAIPSALPVMHRVILTPVVVTATHAEGQEVPDGICILPTQAVLLNAINASVSNYIIKDSWVKWQKRQLNGDGSFENWRYITEQPNFDPISGIDGVWVPLGSGIFQARCEITLPGGAKVYIPYLRNRNARSIKNGDGDANENLKAGKPDYVGVANFEDSLTLRNAAVGWLGSTAYAKKKQVKHDPNSITNANTFNLPKCNIFVSHVAIASGFPVPYFYTKIIVPNCPRARQDWFDNPEENVNLDLAGWKFQGTETFPHPGMVVASNGAGSNAGGTSGHVGIVDYDGSWINSGPLTVNKYIHISDVDTTFKPNAMRSLQPAVP